MVKDQRHEMNYARRGNGWCDHYLGLLHPGVYLSLHIYFIVFIESRFEYLGYLDPDLWNARAALSSVVISLSAFLIRTNTIMMTRAKIEQVNWYQKIDW